MITLKRTDSTNIHFTSLVKELDLDLKIRDGEEHDFFAQYNKIDLIQHVVVAYFNEQPIGCGAIKHYADSIMEVKRMYVKESYRGKGGATRVLKELETWANELGYDKCILETGLKQPEAIALYEKSNYKKIRNYGRS